MNSISFIACGDKVTNKSFEKILAANVVSTYKNVCVEYIFYFTNAPVLVEPLGLKFVHSQVAGITSFQKAIAAASGDNLIFTTFSALQADIKMVMLKQTYQLKSFMVAAPLQTNRFMSSTGIRYVKNASYYVTSKSYAIHNSNTLTNPTRAIVQANKNLAFVGIPHISIESTKYMIKRFIFSKPYIKIIENIFQVQKNRITMQLNARQAEKLRRQVAPVIYSPNIPVFVICRDRVEPLKALVAWCEEEGLKNIILIDNNSSYPPLLDYYKTTPHEVIRLNSNIGHTSPWQAGILDVYAAGKPFIVSDPDVIPLPEAHGAVQYFCKLLTSHPERTKVGFGLKIDDLPDSYDLKEHVIAWESQFWVSEVHKNVYDAEIDTTFAVYRKNTPYTLGPGLRTGGKYMARHEPWYVDSKKSNDEIIYYRKNANKIIGSWGTNSSELNATYANHKVKLDTFIK